MIISAILCGLVLWAIKRNHKPSKPVKSKKAKYQTVSSYKRRVA